MVKKDSGAILAVLCMAQLMFGIDITIVQVANPTIERVLHFTPESLQWTITGYSLTFGGFLLLGGRLGDILGRRQVFTTGMAGFALSSAGAGAATSATFLIVCRAAQGLFAALVSPSVLALLGDSFPEGRERERAYGLWASAISSGGITGYLVGGSIVSLLGWRGIFYINIPVCAAAVVMSLRLFPRQPRPTSRPGLDLPGAVTVTAGVALIIYGLGRAEEHGWGSSVAVGCFAGALALLAAFAAIERASAEPLLPLRILHRRPAVGNLLAGIQATVMGSGVFLNSLYLQQVFHYSPVVTGLAVIPLSVAIIAASNVSSRLVWRVGPRVLAPLGLALIGAGLLWLSYVPDHGTYAATYLPAVLAEGLGLGLAVVPVVNTSTSGVAAEDRGLVGGVYNMSQQLGSAIGIATLVTVVAAGTKAAHVGGTAAEAIGIRLGYRVGTFVALCGALIAVAVLPRRTVAPPVGAERAEIAAIDGAQLKLGS